MAVETLEILNTDYKVPLPSTHFIPERSYRCVRFPGLPVPYDVQYSRYLNGCISADQRDEGQRATYPQKSLKVLIINFMYRSVP